MTPGIYSRLFSPVGSLDLGDWLSFIVEPDADMPKIAGQGMVYDGFRFRAEARLAGKVYGDPFGVDIGFADVLTTEPDVAQGSRFLEFAGVEPRTFRLYPRHAHIAEKLHAYTMPRDRSNTRVKDLPDLALLASVGPLDAAELRRAIE
ncbi:MAG TPA: nucleotidyl transferase AbiEii/AbiGii toxin family protein, partial [Polyangiaceae bacterium]